MKKPSEYKLNGMHYITRIRKEEVTKQIGDDIFFQCCIGSRRPAEYRCTIGHLSMTMCSPAQMVERIDNLTKTIISADTGEELHPTDRAKMRIGAMIYEFVDKTGQLADNGCRIDIAGSYGTNECGESIYRLCYDSLPDYTYEGMIWCHDSDGREVIRYYSGVTAGYMLLLLGWKNRKLGFMGEDMLLMSASVRGDRLLELEIRNLTDDVTEEERYWVDLIAGRKTLPKLGEEYDKSYFVIANTIRRDVLKQAGYLLLHRSNICMAGSTRRTWELNPHRKIAIDATTYRNEPISFGDYVKMHVYEAYKEA
ncbi:MAG: hypothetical protein J5824_01690 [Lachnospiraceae bacterium]|nr:hypothetical protein [Lachnospiraceae bacterium]